MLDAGHDLALGRAVAAQLVGVGTPRERRSAQGCGVVLQPVMFVRPPAMPMLQGAVAVSAVEVITTSLHELS